MTTYSFTNVINPGDPTFNQLLGINDNGEIVGYFGDGNAGHPNKGYDTSLANLHHFTSQNFPTSAQTQVIGINDSDRTVGFWAPTNLGGGQDENFGFWTHHLKLGQESVQDPHTGGSPPINNLLGINNHGEAVGFYTDSTGMDHGYEFNTNTGRFSAPITINGDSTTASAIDDVGLVGGFYAVGGGNFDSFLKMGNTVQTITDPGMVSTQLLGLNENGTLAVGDAVNAAGKMFGFVYNGSTFQNVAFGNSQATTFNGVNDAGDIVGFYVSARAGNTIGLLARPVASASIGASLNSVFNEHAATTLAHS